MRKEIIVAIVFGVALGLTVAVFMIFNLKKAETKIGNSLAKIGPTQAVKSMVTDLQPLEIAEPKDNAIFDGTKIKIKGKAPKEALIIIQSPIKELIFKNKNQDFEVDFPIALGENKITVAAYSAGNNSTPQVRSLNIYYLDEQ